ncbi:MAG: FAD-dependent oxidoreductase [Victivallales bacterium]|nr:FAD-dependent oxidoreductase [Victivallales bacterium]
MNRSLVSLLLLGWALAVAGPPRDIPVAYDVDLVVAGGGCGAVATAETAARSGARVLLITSRNYLGEDMAGTMQLWLEPGEEPEGEMAKKLYEDPFLEEGPGLPYTYVADQVSDKRHPDTKVPSRLRRARKATDAQHESVQYPNDVTITADLGMPTQVREITATAFLRSRDFAVRDALVQVSRDGKAWEDFGRSRSHTVGDRQEFVIPVARSIRHARLCFRRAKSAKRILLGSIKFIGETDDLRSRAVRASRPLHAKKTLENALRDAGASFLFGCYATTLLVDADGRASGLVMSNRMGVQAIRAKAVVDATEHAVLARAGNLSFREADERPRTARWVVIAEKPTARKGLTARKLPIPVTVYDLKGRAATPGAAAWYEYTFETKVADEPAARMAFEAECRGWLYNDTQLFTADRPVLVPQRPIVSRFEETVTWGGANSLPLDVCRPAAMAGLWVLGGCSDVPRDVAEKLLRPMSLLALGSRLGERITKEIASQDVPTQVSMVPPTADGNVSGDVREALLGLRPTEDQATVRDAGASLPILGRYDVVVVGGGTSGAPAGIAAARQGAKTLVLEYLHGLGGVGTLGMIGKYWYGNRVGFAAESPENPIEVRMQFYLSELRKAGGEVWFGTLGCGAVTDGNRVTGVVVATPFGRGVVLAKVVIDGTGNADIAAVAGAETRFVDPFFALQNSHIPPREIGASYINGNRAPIDAADPVDVTSAMAKFPARSFDRGQIISSRERQRIVGDYELDWLDQLNRRTFSDSITLGQSDYDSHGYQVHPYFMLKPARPPGDHKRQFYSFVPYRCLLPKGLNGILVVGLGISVHRDALPIVRMQPDLMNIGYAAGLAAARSAKAGTSLRDLDVDRLQAELVAVGILARDVPSQRDSYPLSATALAAAVAGLPTGYEGLALVLADPEQSKPLLRAAYDQSAAEERLAYAHVLGILGDAHGVPALVQQASALIAKGDFTYRREADGMDRLNQLLWALGRSGDPRATATVIRLADAGAVATSARFRAVVVSLGATGGKLAVPTLRRLLAEKQGSNSASELMVACALRQCDRSDALSQEVLTRLAGRANGPFARLAQRMLAK